MPQKANPTAPESILSTVAGYRPPHPIHDTEMPSAPTARMRQDLFTRMKRHSQPVTPATCTSDAATDPRSGTQQGSARRPFFGWLN